MRRLLALLFSLPFLLASVARAETYKWVDDKGVVNYSNTPPPGAAKSVKPIADRVSTYEPDPSMQRVAYSPPSPYEVMQQQEWLQRQRLMAERQNVQTVYDNGPVDPYTTYYRSGYYYPVNTVRPVVRNRNNGVRVSHH
ncbi:hypothetical protein AYO46_00995 [Betaproteobacteria bacterium SCGC AG-212-J23]|nr:hypothetical protein AYO46_00995 [Betaproteobacteria bacterium SCGC AG-212-J23]